MKYNNEPSRTRKILVTTTAGIAAVGLFVAFFASSYFFLPPEVLHNKGTVAAKNSQTKSAPLTSHGHAELTVSVNGKT